MQESPLQQQFLTAYDDYADALFRHCAFRLSDRERGKECMQETFQRAWEYVSDGKVVKNLRAFLYRTASNLITDEYRRRAHQKKDSLEALQEEGFEIPSEELHPKETVDRQFSQEEIMRVLDTLEDSYRTVVIMRYIDNLEPREIAKILNISTNVVSVRLHRGLQKLRPHLSSTLSHA